MAIRGKWNNSATKNDRNQISSYVSSRSKWPPLTEIWGPWDECPGRRSCARYQVTWYNFEQYDWFGINYHIGILVYRDMYGTTETHVEFTSPSLSKTCSLYLYSFDYQSTADTKSGAYLPRKSDQWVMANNFFNQSS